MCAYGLARDLHAVTLWECRLSSCNCFVGVGVQTVFMQLFCGCGCADCLHAIKLVDWWEGRAFIRLVQGGRLAEGCHAVNFAGMALKRATMLWVCPCGR